MSPGGRPSPLDPKTTDTAWRQILTAAGVPTTGTSGRGRGLHELRRTFATRLRAADIPLEDAARLGRWASAQVLLGHYAAVDDTRLRAAAGAGADGLDR